MADDATIGSLFRDYALLPRNRRLNTQAGVCLRKPLTAAFIGALVIALAVVVYLYYQRTSSDITVRLPKFELKP
jgi:hypothetical protein